MKYYKCVKEDRHDPATGYTTIKDELLTEKERITRFKSLTNKYFEIVEISKNKTFIFFGVRFEKDL